MVSLIIAIIAIALIVAVVAATSYFGGGSISDSQAQAEAVRLKNEEQQILASADLFNADHRRWPTDLAELVNTGYLKAVPKGAVQLSTVPAAEVLLSLIPSAFAAESAPIGWSMPRAQQPIFATSVQVPKDVCRKYNLASRGDDGILRHPFANLISQCFGEQGTYQVVVRKQGQGVVELGEVLTPVASGGLPAADAGDSWWDTPPAGGMTAPTDPDKGLIAQLVLGTSNVALGAVQVDQAITSSTITLRNEGGAVATAIAVTAPDGFAVVDSTCAATLSARGACSFALRFSPVEARSYDGTLVVHSANGGQGAVRLTGLGELARASIDNVDFGDVLSGEILDGAVTLRNSGVGPLQVAAAQVVGAGFSADVSACAGTVAAGHSCFIPVSINAQGISAHQGSLSVQTSAGLQVAQLRGQSKAALVQASLPGYDFQDTQAGDSAVSAQVLMRNQGNMAGSSMVTASPEGFSVAGTTCAGPLAPGGECSYTFKFTPTEEKRYSGDVVVSSSARIALSGQGRAAKGNLTGAALGRVYAGSSTTGTVQLSNTGIGLLRLTDLPNSASVTGAGFSFIGTTCTTELAKGASCSIRVSYAPTSLQAQTGQVVVKTSAGTLSAAVSGEGYWGPDAIRYMGFVAGPGNNVNMFGSAPGYVHGSKFLFANTTGSVLSNVAVTLAPSSFIYATSNTCKSTMQPGDTCEFMVGVNNTAAATVSATLTVKATGYTSNAYSISATTQR